MKKDRVFVVVMDSFGIGALPDAAAYGDAGSDTLGAVARAENFSAPFLRQLGLFNIDGVTAGSAVQNPLAVHGRLKEKSAGKDTTTGHWEMTGIVSETPFPTYPQGFPEEILSAFTRETGRDVLCNRPYSGTDVIRDFGKEHLATGKLIVYTSADSVFQIAAHTDVIPVPTLYRYCRTARNILTGKNAVARVIARPFGGEYPFYRTQDRKDFALPPPRNLLHRLQDDGFDVIAVGKINDIFCGEGITRNIVTHNNAQGHLAAKGLLQEPFHGLAFINLVDFDMLYGHRNDARGYANAVRETDAFLQDFAASMGAGDALLVTADHGCDPSTPSTDHSREYVPFLLYGQGIAPKNFGTADGIDCVGKTVEKLLRGEE